MDAACAACGVALQGRSRRSTRRQSQQHLEQLHMAVLAAARSREAACRSMAAMHRSSTQQRSSGGPAHPRGAAGGGVPHAAATCHADAAAAAAPCRLQAPKPSAGPHKTRECLPLILLLRNRLKYALTGKEVTSILMQRLVEVDGKVRTDRTYPVGFMDVVDIPKTGALGCPWGLCFEPAPRLLYASLLRCGACAACCCYGVCTLVLLSVRMRMLLPQQRRAAGQRGSGSAAFRGARTS